jgi:hypothetical protein
MLANGLPVRVLDVLETDGSWLTTAGVTLMLPDAHQESVEKALFRLRRRGLVDHRVVQMAGLPRQSAKPFDGSRIGGVETRSEWKTL